MYLVCTFKNIICLFFYIYCFISSSGRTYLINGGLINGFLIAGGLITGGLIAGGLIAGFCVSLDMQQGMGRWWAR